MTSTPTWCLENQASFASIHVILPPNTKVHCESDAVVTFSGGGTEVQGVLSGGSLWSSLSRVLFGGESFFTTQVENTSHEQVGDVMLAPKDPGGIALHPLSSGPVDGGSGGGSDLLLTSGAYVASDVGVTISTELQSRLKNSLLSGTGFFLLRASGKGMVACAAYGSIHKYVLKVGEKRSVDNGHLVAWSDTLTYRTGLANARGGVFTSMTSGEGLMCHFEGPGTIYLQSHKLGEAETVIKKGKQTGANTVALTGAAACVPFFFVIVIVIWVVVMTGGLANMNIRMQTDAKNGFQSAYESDYSSRSSQRRSNHQGYRTVGEF